jgi:hypothetical protein
MVFLGCWSIPDQRIWWLGKFYIVAFLQQNLYSSYCAIIFYIVTSVVKYIKMFQNSFKFWHLCQPACLHFAYIQILLPTRNTTYMQRPSLTNVTRVHTAQCNYILATWSTVSLTWITTRQFIFFGLFFKNKVRIAENISFQPGFYWHFFNLQNICHTNVIKLKFDVKYSHKTFWNVFTLRT